MSTKRPKSKIIEQEGILEFSKQINISGSCFNEIDTKNDVGIDGYLEIFKDETATGCCIGIQIKSGKSYFKNNKLVLNADMNHFKYWSSHLLPVIIVGYHPEIKKVFWFDISDYLLKNIKIIEKGPYSLSFDINKAECQIENLIEYCSNKYKKENTLNSLIRSMNTLSTHKSNTSFEDLVSSIKYLFYNYRNELFVVSLILSIFQNTDEPNLLILIISVLSYYVSHGDIYWHKENIIKYETSDYIVKNVIADFKTNEIIKMLNLLEDRGSYSRGGIGQIVFHIIDANNNREDILKDICFEIECPYIVKYYAFYALVYMLQFKDLKLTLIVIEKFYNLYHKIDNEFGIEFIYNYIKEGNQIEIS